MKLPRHLSAAELVKLLSRLGYQVTRQKGSHLRLTTELHGEHHVTIPNHDAIRLGTLASVLKDVADHFQMPKEELSQRLFGD